MYAAASNLDTDHYRLQTEHTLAIFERSGIAVFPSRTRRKGSYVDGWPEMPVDEAIATTRRDLAKKPINLAGRTGDGTAVFDLDAKNGVDPREVLQLLRRLVGPAIIAIVRTSRGFHIWLQVVEPVGNGFCAFIGGEIFSGPHLAMVPPSVHPSGHQYTWEVEPRYPDAAANLKSLGLVPDKPAPSARTDSERAAVPAPSEIQEEFVRLMAAAGVPRGGGRSQTLDLCPWHDDRSPSLSINWDAAVLCCFSEHCQARGGINGLRRRVRGNTPSYRQWSDVENASLDHREGDHLSGDKLGCSDVEAAAARLAGGLQELGLDERAASVRDCRATFRVGKCTSCARTPAFPISCSHPLCIRCMPGRLAADWARHRASLPAKVNVVLLRPRGVVAGSPGVLRTVRSRFTEWRKRAGITAGVYGGRLDRDRGAVIMLAIPSAVSIPASSQAFDVEVVALDRKPAEFLGWLQSQYVEEARSWGTVDELKFLIDETRARRRFQGFGAFYGEPTETASSDSKEEAQMGPDSEAKAEEGRRPLGRISGGSFKGNHAKGDPACPFCGGAVELYPFTVPASEVEKVGTHWLWGGASAGPAERRRYAR